MDLYTAIKERRTCRDFLADPIEDAVIEKILEAAVWAPSPLNMQPWEFMVITNAQLRERIYSEADRCRVWALEKTGWKWLGGLWFTFFDKKELRGILGIDPEKVPVALVCLGRPGAEPADMPRKGVEKKITYMR